MTTVPVPSTRYPDNGELLEDASLLRNAVHFSRPQRAFSAHALLERDLDKLDAQFLAFLAVDAYCAEMTSMEDVLGWLFILRDWQPGTPGGSLFFLLSTVQVGTGNWKESDALELLEQLNAAGLRRLLHIPSDGELEADGFSPEVRRAIDASIAANLDGLKRIAKKRLAARRGRVVAFNKLKHLQLALPTLSRGKPEVLVPSWLPKDIDGRRFHFAADGVHIQSLWLEASAENVRLTASRAIVGQAVLHSLLGVILWARYGEPYVTPPWAEKAYDLPGWYDDPSDAGASDP